METALIGQPAAIYNAMIHPLAPYAIRGVLWYQGEANAAFLNDGANYTAKQQALIMGWRKAWGQGDFPFYFVQIAPYNYGGNPEALGEFWEAQAAAEKIPNLRYLCGGPDPAQIIKDVPATAELVKLV